MTTSERDLAALKHDARVRARAARAGIDAESQARAATAIASRLLALPELQRAGSLLLSYAALPEEIDPAAAVAALQRIGVRTLYPRVEAAGVLGIHLATESQLAEGRYGIREPLTASPKVGPDRVDAVFVPGVAFDELGFRLGYGGGYYDRLLPMMRHEACRIGLAYDEQIVEELPCEEHDVRLDVIVTPTRTLRF